LRGKVALLALLQDADEIGRILHGYMARVAAA
jgi:hypothetical protein